MPAVRASRAMTSTIHRRENGLRAGSPASSPVPGATYGAATVKLMTRLYEPGTSDAHDQRVRKKIACDVLPVPVAPFISTAALPMLFPYVPAVAPQSSSLADLFGLVRTPA